jgi:hypothetical protein
VIGAWCTMAGPLSMSSAMMTGSSKGWNKPGPAQTGETRHPQSQCGVPVLQKSHERRDDESGRKLGFRLRLAKIELGTHVSIGFLG